MAQIIPIRDLKNTAEISEKCKASNEPIFVTKNGYGDMVVMSMDLYTRTMAEVGIFKKLKEAEDEIERGAKPISEEAFFGGLRAKYEKL
ncbi:MAG: type II toxin-antitoxin system Phd/YefM family antitoxin [Clostridia bacterium]|nr:type II toxin-antitoxin system Phd/YefM family antitoxin [Clostridia bacterium]